MGEQEDSVFQPEFNRSTRVEVSPCSLSEDAGALLLREVMEKLGFQDVIGSLLDHRDPDRVTYSLSELFRTRVLLVAQGWRDQDDADALRDDPVLRLSVSDRTGDRPLRPAERPREAEGLASQPTLSRTQAMLGSRQNRRNLSAGLLEVSRRRMRAAHGHRKVLVIDIDSTPDPVYGHQEGAAYNGHYQDVCYHPLIAFSDTGDLLAVTIRPGNVHTANEVRAFLRPILPKLQEDCDELWIRMDAGYADGKLLAWLRAQGVRFLTRLPNNPALRKEVETWRERTLRAWAAEPSPDGKPREATREFWHRVKTWTFVERVVAVLVERDADKGELLHHDFFLATNVPRPDATSAHLLECYRQRGTAEAHIGEFKRVLAPTLSSVQRLRKGAPPRKRRIGMAENEVSLLIAAFAYELVHAVRCLAEAALDRGFSLQKVRENLLKLTATVTRHARQVRFRIDRAKAGLWRLVSAVLPTLDGAAGVTA